MSSPNDTTPSVNGEMPLTIAEGGGGAENSNKNDDDVDEDNQVLKDGTRARNLTLWEAASWRQKIYAVFEVGSFPSDMPVNVDRFSNVFNVVMIGLIIVSCISVMLESYPEYRITGTPILLRLIECSCVAVFTFDLSVRMLCTPQMLAFVLDPLNAVDVIAVMPFYISDFGGTAFVDELRIVRVLRLIRILRMIRSQNVPGLRAMIEAVSTSVYGLTLFVLRRAGPAREWDLVPILRAQCQLQPRNFTLSNDSRRPMVDRGDREHRGLLGRRHHDTDGPLRRGVSDDSRGVHPRVSHHDPVR